MATKAKQARAVESTPVESTPVPPVESKGRPVPPRTKRAFKDEAEEQLRQQLGREPTDEEKADRANALIIKAGWLNPKPVTAAGFKEKAKPESNGEPLFQPKAEAKIDYNKLIHAVASAGGIAACKTVLDALGSVVDVSEAAKGIEALAETVELIKTGKL